MSRVLLTLIAAATLLSVGHMVDHAMRDDLRWPSTELFAFLVVGLVIYTSVAAGFYFYAKGRVGSRFWTIFSFAGVLFGWAAHFSPFTDQPPSYILGAYNYSFAGWLALGVLVALMLVMGMAGAYSAYLWHRSG